MNESTWHPILSTVEGEPGHWELVDPLGRKYGDVRIVRRGDEVGYRGLDRSLQLVGYYRTLLSAVKAVHMRYVYEHSGAPVDRNASPAHGMPPRG
jgi:hypothetical protein